MIMTAKHHGRCEKCGGAINPGDMIEWSPRPWICHTTCPGPSVAESSDGVSGNTEDKGQGAARTERRVVWIRITSITVGTTEGER
jgi:hypothetical protein